MAELHDFRRIQFVEVLVDDDEAAGNHGTQRVPWVADCRGHLSFEHDTFAEHVVQHVPQKVSFIPRRRVDRVVQLGHHGFPDVEVFLVLDD